MFVPLAMDTFGRLGKGGVEMVRRLARSGASRGAVPEHVLRKANRKRISCALVNGNGLMFVRAADIVSRGAGVDWLPGLERPTVDL